MKVILIILLSICPLFLKAQIDDSLYLAQKEALKLLNNLRIKYDSIHTDCLGGNVHVYFERDLYGSLYFRTKSRAFKLEREKFFNDDIKKRLSLLLDDEYEQFEIEILGQVKQRYRFNMSIVVWMVVLSRDDMLIKKMIENYKNGIYSDKVNHLIEKSLASVGYQPFRDYFIKTHTYDSTKSGDELLHLMNEIYDCFFNKEGALMYADYLLSEKEYIDIVPYDGPDGTEYAHIPTKIYYETSMYFCIKNKDFEKKIHSEDCFSKSNRIWMANWVKRNYASMILVDDLTLSIKDFY